MADQINRLEQYFLLKEVIEEKMQVVMIAYLKLVPVVTL